MCASGYPRALDEPTLHADAPVSMNRRYTPMHRGSNSRLSKWREVGARSPYMADRGGDRDRPPTRFSCERAGRERSFESRILCIIFFRRVGRPAVGGGSRDTPAPILRHGVGRTGGNGAAPAGRRSPRRAPGGRFPSRRTDPCVGWPAQRRRAPRCPRRQNENAASVPPCRRPPTLLEHLTRNPKFYGP